MKNGFIYSLWEVDEIIILLFVWINGKCYFGEVADDEFDVPRHSREKIDLEGEELLDEVEIFFFFAGEAHFGGGVGEL